MIKTMRNDLEFYLSNEGLKKAFLDIEKYCEKENIPVIINGLSEYDLLSFKEFDRYKNMTIEKNEEKYTIYDNSIKEELMALYSSCFDDSKEFIDYFFADFSIKNTYYERKDRKIVSCFFLHYKTIFYLDKEYTIPYIVGACTKYEYRNKGLFKAVFNRFLNDNESPFCLLSPDIFGFYEKFGFATIEQNETSCDIQKFSSGTFNDIVKIYDSVNADIIIKRDWDYYKKIWDMENCQYLINEDKTKYVINGREIEEYFSPIYNKDRIVPFIMGRIINLSLFSKIFSIDLKEIKIIDEHIIRNNINTGCFRKCKKIDDLFIEVFKNKSHLFLDRY